MRLLASAIAVPLALTGCHSCSKPAATAPSPYLKGQLHLHSSRSGDSHTLPDQVLRWYREHGYDFIVFTDHNRAAPALQSASPLVFSGIELTQNLRTCSPREKENDDKDDGNDEPCLLHVNGLLLDGAAGLDPWRPALLSDRRAAYRQAIRQAVAAGGIAQLNHPNFHHAVDADLLTALVREDGLRLFEVANGSWDAGNDGDATHPSTEALWDRVLTAGGLLFGTATDDAHHYDDVAALQARGQAVFPAGRGFVMVRAARDRKSIHDALLRGDFYASTGVLLDRADVEAGVLVLAAAATSPGPHTFSFIGTGGSVLARTQGRQARLPLATAPPGYVRAVVENAQHQKAWTQPVPVPR